MQEHDGAVRRVIRAGAGSTGPVRIEAPALYRKGPDQRLRRPKVPRQPSTREHRLFSFISINWRGRPLRTYETVINLIGNTSNRNGLIVRARLDRRRYPTGKKVSKRELRALKVEPDDFHGEWNYVIKPRKELH